ncbi:MAG TPA: addiction module antitoxin RelB [Lentisphaeria bacterium]|jgi:hypothetical protein|nr:addiction module antitoxin RelB [Lentisphaeria bacterium]
MNVAELEKEALDLPQKDRAVLAQKLLLTLDEHSEAIADWDLIWAEEARRRHEQIADGEVACRPAAEVFADARERIRALNA